MKSQQMALRKSSWEVLHFRLLFVTLFVWFLALALLHRVKIKRRTELNLWEYAKRNASSTAPYAFMRI